MNKGQITTMLCTTVKNSSIKGICTVLPKTNISLTDMPDLYNGNKRKIERLINLSGFKNRRVAKNTTTSGDLCFEAAKKLISGMNIDKNSIDGIVFVSTTPDYFMPPTACVIHNKLKLKDDCLMFDMNHACSGFLYGLYAVSSMLNKDLKRILLLVGDTFNKYTDMFNNNSAPIFGDGGAAILIEYDENAEPMYFDIGSQTDSYESIFCENGAFKNPPKKEDFYPDGTYKYNSSMDGMKVFKFATEEIPKSLNRVLEYSKNSENTIDYCFLHQANKFILSNIAESLNFPLEKVPMSTISDYGNLVSASIPAAICEERNKIKGKNLKTLMSGFGVGLTYISAVINLNNIYCSEITNYTGE